MREPRPARGSWLIGVWGRRVARLCPRQPFVSQFLLAARVDIGYNHGVESLLASYAVDGWHGRIREDMFAHARDHVDVPTMQGLGLEHRRLERLHSGVKHLDSRTHTVLSPRVVRGALRSAATCMHLPLHETDEALLRSAARVAPRAGAPATGWLTLNEAEVAVSSERLLGVVAASATYGVRTSSTHSADPRALPQPLPPASAPRGVRVPGAVVVNVTLHAGSVTPSGLELHLVVSPRGAGGEGGAPGDWGDDSVGGAGLWKRWKAALQRRAEASGAARRALASWEAAVATAGPCLTFLPPLVSMPGLGGGGTGVNASGPHGAGPGRRRHDAWARGLPDGLALGGVHAWRAAEAAAVPRPHAVVELGSRCLPVSALGLRYEIAVVDFEPLDCEAAWTRPADEVCADPDASPRACSSPLLRSALDEAAWRPHEEIDVECDAIG